MIILLVNISTQYYIQKINPEEAKFAERVHLHNAGNAFITQLNPIVNRPTNCQKCSVVTSEKVKGKLPMETTRVDLIHNI